MYQDFNITHRNTCNQLKFTLTKWAKVCDCRPVVNTCKTKPEFRIFVRKTARRVCVNERLSTK